MPIIFGNYAIRGVDTSEFNLTVNMPELKKTGALFNVMRAGHGKRIDPKFRINWVNCKGVMLRMVYWYLDYYSNWYNPASSAYGMTDFDWGKLQAQNLWAQIKDDNDGTIVWLDIESGDASYSPAITNVWIRVGKMIDGFFTEMDKLNGKRNGIYCSLGLLNNFSVVHRTRPLWVAWYNEYQTPDSVVKMCTATKGWTSPYIWQYASHGDVNGDGVSDGLTFGTGIRQLDLNIWLKTAADWNTFSAGQAPPAPPVTAGFWAQCTAAKSLTIRKLPNGSATVLGYLMNGEKKLVYEVSNGWYRIGEGQWVSGSYMQIITTPPVEPPPVVAIPVMTVPAFSQKDDRWKNDPVGTSTSTMGEKGCAVSCLAAVAAFLGKNTNPGQLNRDLVNKDGYESDILLIWDAITKIYPDITVDWDNFIKDSALVTEAGIDAVLVSRRLVIAQVDHNPSTTSLEPHWVVIKGKNSNGYVIMDTWDGATVDLKSRYEEVLRMVVFSKVTAVPVEVTDPEKLKRLWAVHPELH